MFPCPSQPRTCPTDPSRVGVHCGLRLRLWHGVAGGAGDVRHSSLHGSALDKLIASIIDTDLERDTERIDRSV